MDYGILGPLEVVVDGRTLDLGPRKQRSLLALLLIHANRTVSTDGILEALWADDALGKENALWVYISRLRAIIAEATAAEVLVTKDHGYSLQVNTDSLDSVVFEELTREGLAVLDANAIEASELLRRALGLWRGAALEDFAYDEFAQMEIARLAALRLTCIDGRIEADLRCGRSGELVAELEQQLEQRPYDETPIRQIMLALYRSGRQTESLRTFERYRRRLGEDAGTEPSPELCRLEEQILFHDEHLGHHEPDGAGSLERANPYRGLRAFREEDAHLFFGRDALSAKLLTTLSREPIVTVIGPSGSGKSSVVRSGLIPGLRKGALPGSESWLVASMFPGSHPSIELEAALLRSSLDAPDSLRVQLDGAPDGILRAALRVAPSDDATVVIIIDQMEELFTVCDDATADRFLSAVVRAARDPHERVRFVMTLRADFYTNAIRHTDFGAAMGPGIVNVVPMAPEELEFAASGPARAAGVRLEPALEAALIGDVLGEPGALPLFEFALTDLFDRRVGDTLTLETYRSMHGIEGAVSRKAGQLFDRLTPSQQEAARQVFLRLVSITEGETRSRRRVEASELLGLDTEVVDLQAVLGSFGSERLLAFDRSERTGAPTVEVAHEALLDHWDRLSNWIVEAQFDVRENARLASLAADWIDHERDDAYLLSPGGYRDHAGRTATSSMALSRTEREYLEASGAAHDRRERAESERAAREEAATSRARRNAWGLVAAATVATIAAVVVGWVVTRPADPTVAYVHSAQVTSLIDQMVEGGFQTAELGLPIEYVDVPVHDGRPDAALERIIQAGADLVVIPFEMEALVYDAAAANPDVHFVVLDAEFGSEAENISRIAFDTDSGAYLMGVAAASTSNSGRIGFVGGWQDAFMERWAAAYSDGARSIEPDVEVDVAWVLEDGDLGFNHPALAYAAATSLFDEGADVVFTAAGDSRYGATEAARDFSENHDVEVWAIGVDADEGYLADAGQAPYVLTSMLKRFDVAVEASIAAWLDGSLAGLTTYGLVDGAIGYSTGNAAIEPALPALASATSAIIAGTADPGTVSNPNTVWRSEPDVRVGITAGSGSCSTETSSTIQSGDVVGFDLSNQTGGPVWFAVGAAPAGVTSSQLQQAFMETGDIFAPLDATGADRRNTWVVPAGATYELRSTFHDDEYVSAFVTCFHDDGIIVGDFVPVDPN